MRNFQVEVLGMGFNIKKYPGAFTPVVESVIKSTIQGKVLHLYSGTSFIGDTRVDLEHEHATHNLRVEEFCKQDKSYWDFVLLDPPYAVTRRSKLKDYAESASLSADVKWRTEIKMYLQTHTDNILWLDYCAPMIKCFKREKIWLFLPGGYHSVRVLSWLKKETKLML
jgi:hypothetical protein